MMASCLNNISSHAAYQSASKNSQSRHWKKHRTSGKSLSPIFRCAFRASVMANPNAERCTSQIPFEWQQQVIRACITLRLLTYQETGAIIAAATTSIPKQPKGQLQDLRYCRVQDMPHIIRTLNRLGMAPSMSQYLGFISNIVAEYVTSEDADAALQGIYGISLETLLHQKEVHRLSGYRGESPVVVGNNVPSPLSILSRFRMSLLTA